MPVIVEVVCYSIEDVLRARQGGAQRVELCSDPGAGGTTPSAGFIKQSVALGDVDVMVMIRPRGGDFLYTREELAVMHEDIKLAAKLGAKGVVFGVLDQEGFFDNLAMSSLIQLAKSLHLEVTCHRAFDVARDPEEALLALIDLGVDRLLTSGQAQRAVDGIPLLERLVHLASGKIAIMPGGGVRPDHVSEFIKLGVQEVHTGSNTRVASKMMYSGPNVKMGADDAKAYHMFVDDIAVRAILETVNR